MAAFLDSDENFMMYRRFGWIQSRLLLKKQSEISDLEKDLEVQDGFLADGEEVEEGQELVEEQSDYKNELLKKLEVKFGEYGKFKRCSPFLMVAYSYSAQLLAAAREMMVLRRPTSSEYESLRNYCDYDANFTELEEEWTHCKEDMVTLRPGREHAWLDRVIEYVLGAFQCPLIRYMFCSKVSIDLDTICNNSVRLTNTGNPREVGQPDHVLHSESD